MYGEWVSTHRMLKSGSNQIYTEYGIYLCIGRKKEPRCRHQQRIDYVHRLVLDELKKIIYKKAVTRQLINERSKRMQTNTDDLVARIESKDKAIKEKEAFLEKCKNDYKRGDLAAPLYSEFYEETNREIGILQGEIKK